MGNTNDITVLSFCAGYAGLELGLHRALGRPLRVVAVEIEAFAAANLVAKAEEGKLAIEALYPDVTTFPAERFSGCFDWLTAGFPCQPFSTAGLRKGTEDERHLWPHIERAIDVVRPGFVFLENVAGIISAKTIDHRPDLKEYCRGAAQRLGTDWGIHFAGRLAEYGGVSVLQYVLHRLERLGYECATGIFSAEEVGAPHRRERVFILAYSTRVYGPGVELASIRRGGGICEASEASRKLGNPRSDVHGRLAGSIQEASPQDIDNARKPRWGGDNTGGTGELANTRPNDGRQREPEQQQKERPEELSGGNKLANSQRLGRRGRDNGEPAGQGRALQTEGSGELGIPQSQRCGETGSDSQQCELRASSIGESPCNSGNCATCKEGQRRWPARPGQKQYYWEEPRTVESGMGRTVDGFASRVDELRLLGNGVVEKQAAKAFTVLWQKMFNED